MHKISLCMIVRNESRVIRRCLESILPIIDYWIICDTGSTDDTMDIIRNVLSKVPGELHQDEWRNFAWNRNRYLEHARGKTEYVLVMDADQVLMQKDFDPAQLRLDAYHCAIRYHDLEHGFIKVFRPEAASYAGVIHNYVNTTGNIGHLESLVFQDLHDGHRSRNYQEKLRRDIDVLEEAVTGEEDKPRYTYYLAQTYREAGRHEQAAETYLRRAAMGGWEEEVWSSLYNAGRCYQALKRFDETLTQYLKAFDFRPSRAEPLYRAAEYARNEKRYHTGFMLIRRSLDIPWPSNDILFVETPVYRYLRHFEFVILAYWTGNYAESVKMADYVDTLEGLPEHYRQQNRTNREYGVQKLKSLQPGLDTPAT